MYYFEKERIHLKTNYIDKISLQIGSTVCEKHAVMIHCGTRSWILVGTSLHLFPDICFVAVGMNFDPTCRHRNLSSTTALIFIKEAFRRGMCAGRTLNYNHYSRRRTCQSLSCMVYIWRTFHV